MTKASDNPYPSLLIAEGTAPSSPSAGQQRLFIDSADHAPKVKNSSGTVSSLGGTSGTREIGVTFDGGGTAPAAGATADIVVPASGTITAATMLADAAGSAVIDVWRDTYANAPPTIADTIAASAKPTLSSATKSRDTTLVGWTTAVTAGDVLRFIVDSASVLTRVTLILTYS